MSTVFTALLLLLTSAAAPSATLTRSSQVPRATRLQVTVRTGDVIFTRALDRNLVATFVYEAPASVSPRLTLEHDGNTVRLESTYGDTKGLPVHGVLSIAVPDDLVATFRTTGGRVTAEEVRGSLSGVAAGGDIRLSRLRGTVHITTRGGDIRVVDSEAEGSVHTDGGNIELENGSTLLRATTSAGRVVQRRAGSAGARVLARNDAGGIVLEEASDGSDVSTAAGDVEIGRTSGRVRVRTSAGTVRIRSAGGTLDAASANGGVDATVSAVADVIRVRAEHGAIRLRLPPLRAAFVETDMTWDPRRGRSPHLESAWHITTTTPRDEDAGKEGTMKRVTGRATINGPTGQPPLRVFVEAVDADVILEAAPEGSTR